MTELAPLTPADCDLRDFPFMPVDIVRLFSSDFHTRASDSEWRAGVTLWLKSFHQVPAASLPDDDFQLARTAELGTAVNRWRKLRAAALRGWIKCSDGRLYHKVVAEKALEGWIEKLLRRKSSAAGNAKRHGSAFDEVGFDCAIENAKAMLATLNPQSRSLRIRTPGALPPGGEIAPTGTTSGAKKPPTGTPDGLLPGSQEKEKEKRQGREEPSSFHSDGSAEPQSDSAPVVSWVVKIPTNRFATKGEEYAVTEAQFREFSELYPAVDVMAHLRNMRGWSITNTDKRKTAKGMPAFINRWLARQQNEGPVNGSRPSNGNANGRKPSSLDKHLEGMLRAAEDAEQANGRPQTVPQSGQLALAASRDGR